MQVNATEARDGLYCESVSSLSFIQPFIPFWDGEVLGKRLCSADVLQLSGKTQAELKNCSLPRRSIATRRRQVSGAGASYEVAPADW